MLIILNLGRQISDRIEYLVLGRLLDLLLDLAEHWNLILTDLYPIKLRLLNLVVPRVLLDFVELVPLGRISHQQMFDHVFTRLFDVAGNQVVQL